ncbi:MAG: hypothetical protein GX907_03220 [Clostridiaceae bacterium]|nr:hypothetical protein [Clostridiaceae bacterium]
MTRRLVVYFTIALSVMAILAYGLSWYTYRRAALSSFRAEMEKKAGSMAAALGERPGSWKIDAEPAGPTQESAGPTQKPADPTQKPGGPTHDRGRRGNSDGKGRISYSMGRSSFVSFLQDLVGDDIWLINREDGAIAFGSAEAYDSAELPDNMDALLERVWAGERFFSEDFATVLGTPAMTLAEPVKNQHGQVIAALLMHTPLNAFNAALRQGLLGLVVIILLSSLLSWFLALILIRHFSRPLARIGKVTRELAQGNYAVRTGISGRDAVGTLAAEVDAVGAALTEAEQERAQAESARRRFLASVAHELRTPVTIFRGGVEALRDGVVAPEDVPRYYATLAENSLALERLVNDLLELSRLESPEFTIENHELDFAAVIADAVRSAGQKARSRNIRILTDIPEGEYPLRGDYGRLRQLLLLLLDNAIEFSTEGGTVELSFRHRGTAALLTLRDHGSGMSEETKARLFERFYTTRGSHGGSGLGLPLVREIALRHGIELSFESAIGFGTTFYLQLPPRIE